MLKIWCNWYNPGKIIIDYNKIERLTLLEFYKNLQWYKLGIKVKVKKKIRNVYQIVYQIGAKSRLYSILFYILI